MAKARRFHNCHEDLHRCSAAFSTRSVGCPPFQPRNQFLYLRVFGVDLFKENVQFAIFGDDLQLTTLGGIDADEPCGAAKLEGIAAWGKFTLHDHRVSAVFKLPMPNGVMFNAMSKVNFVRWAINLSHNPSDRRIVYKITDEVNDMGAVGEQIFAVAITENRLQFTNRVPLDEFYCVCTACESKRC